MQSIFLVGLCCSMAALSCGCESLVRGEAASLNPSGQTGPEFREVMKVPRPEELVEAVEAAQVGKLITMSVVDMPVGEFLQMLAIEGDLSIVWTDQIDGALVSLEVVEQPAVEVLRQVGRRLSVEIAAGPDGESMWFLGQLEAQDRATMLARVGRFTPGEVEAAIEVMLTSSGQVRAFDDGTVLISDKLDVITRVGGVIEDLNAQVGLAWVVQFYVVEIVRDRKSTIGVDGEFAVTVAAGYGAMESSSVQAEGRAAFRADVSRGAVHVVNRPLFLLVEGEEAGLSRTQRVPIPQQIILENGSVATTGFSDVDVGTQFNVLLRGGGGDAGGLLEYEIVFGEITGFVEDRPIVSEERIQGTVRVQDGGTYLVGALERVRNQRGNAGLLGLEFTRESSVVSLEVWCLVERV